MCVRTDTALEGVGEADSSPEVAKAIIDAPFSHNVACGLRGMLAGENPLESERIWKKLQRGSQYFRRTSVTMSAISAVDLTLWDIKGKALNQSVCSLLGLSLIHI